MSCTSSQVWLINQTNLVIFWQFVKNSDKFVSIFFTYFIQQNQFGKLYFLKLKYLTFFASSVQLGQMLRILTNNCDRETICYISSRDLRINRLYFDVLNENRNSYLAIYYWNSNPLKYRTNSQNNLLLRVQKKKIEPIISF